MQVPTQQSLQSGQNLQYGSMNPGLITTGIPLNQGVNQGMNQGLQSNLGNHQGFSGINSSLNPSYSLNHPLNSSLNSLNQLSNPSLNTSLNSTLSPQVQTSLGMATYGSHLGMSPYGNQANGLSGQAAYSSMNGVPLYGSAANSVASQQVFITSVYSLVKLFLLCLCALCHTFQFGEIGEYRELRPEFCILKKTALYVTFWLWLKLNFLSLSIFQQAAALQAAGGHYGYGSYPNNQLSVSSAPRAPSAGGLSLPTYYNI